MKKKHIYKAIDVEKLETLSVVSLLTVGCIISIDVAKSKFVAAIATATGEVLRLVRFEHPRQSGAFLRLLAALRDARLEPHVVMEPTGTYGDAIRYQCQRLGIPVHLMSPKHTHDFSEVLDGVPSMRYPKAAMALARLQAIRPARRWEPDPESKRDLRAVLDLRAPVAHTQAHYFGLLEGMLSRHWPELDALIDVRSQRSWMTLLQQMSSPQAVAAATDEATELLRKASRGALSRETVDAIVASARATLGVPMSHGEQTKVHVVVAQIEHETRKLDALDKQLAELVDADPSMQRVASVNVRQVALHATGRVGMPFVWDPRKAASNLRKHAGGLRGGSDRLRRRARLGPAGSDPCGPVADPWRVRAGEAPLRRVC
jgi:hypothetical protein